MRAAIGACLLLLATLVGAQPADDAQATYKALIEADKASQSYFNLMWSTTKPAPDFAEQSQKAFDRAQELQRNLKALYEANAPGADFYWGTYQLGQGQSVLGLPGDMARKYFESALPPLRQSATRGSAAAAWNLGLMYANGWGVQSSKLAASEWYVRSGEGYVKAGEREAALGALERAEGLDPRSAGVKRLRAKLNQP